MNSKITKLSKRLCNGHSITGKQAMNWWGYYRLADGIFKLKRKWGYDIVTTMKRAKNGDTYASYKLAEEV